MRLLPALLLIAAPLFAQEPSEEEQRTEEERRAAESGRATEKRAEEIRRIEQQREESAKLGRLIDELRSKSEAKRKEAMEALTQANMSLDELLPLIAEALERAERARTVYRLAGSTARTLQLGSEAISGSADGTDYTLKSLGDGRYELTATKRDDDGKLMEETKDQGTLKELQEKYLFLRAGLAIQMPAVAAQPVRVHWGDVGVWTGTEVRHDNEYRTVVWGGGGRVGVNVTPAPEELRFHLQLPEGAGFIVQQVVPGSRAEEIGIRRMDILLKLDGELIDSPIQMKKLHERKGVLEIIRRAEARKIDLATVAEEKPAAAPEKVTETPSPEGAR